MAKAKGPEIKKQGASLYDRAHLGENYHEDLKYGPEYHEDGPHDPNKPELGMRYKRVPSSEHDEPEYESLPKEEKNFVDNFMDDANKSALKRQRREYGSDTEVEGLLNRALRENRGRKWPMKRGGRTKDSGKVGGKSSGMRLDKKARGGRTK